MDNNRVKKYKVKLNSVEKIEQLLQETYDIASQTHKSIQEEINKIAKKPVKQVKPGYKKKRAEAIEKVKRKHRREMIESNIKALSKEKNRLKQRQKNIESGKYD
jgi:uncharacterized protein (UPF0297 family)